VVLPILLDIYTYDRRPQYMTYFIVTAFDITTNSHATRKFYGRKTRLNCFGIIHSIKRYFRIRATASLPFMAFFLKYGVFFLYLGGITRIIWAISAVAWVQYILPW
jgi:hypothetical protein